MFQNDIYGILKAHFESENLGRLLVVLFYGVSKLLDNLTPKNFERICNLISGEYNILGKKALNN